MILNRFNNILNKSKITNSLSDSILNKDSYLYYLNNNSIVCNSSLIYSCYSFSTNNLNNLDNSNDNNNISNKIYTINEIKDKLKEKAIHLDIKDNKDWYNVKDLSELPLGQFGGSLYSLLSSVIPEFKWEPWKFNQNTSTLTTTQQHIANPRGFWNDRSNQLLYMQWLAEQMNFDAIKDRDQWYSVKKSDFMRYKGRGLLSIYNDSVYQLLSSLYPDDEWLPWKFDNTPKRFWSDLDNQKRYVKWLANDVLDIKSLKDWYRITKLDFQENYGSSLLALYSGSPAKVITSLVDPTEYQTKASAVAESNHNSNEWQVWRFSCLPRASLLDFDVLKRFIEFTKQYYEIETQADWYRLSWSQIRDIGGFSLIKKNGGFCVSLSKVYPDMHWDPSLFNMPGKKSSQRLLKIFLDRLLLEYTVVEDYRNVDKLRYRSTNSGFQLDFFIEELNLAFEYQGKQHFQDTLLFGESKLYKDRDTEKRLICKEMGITIIDIPYWWDNQIESLIGTIQENKGNQWIVKYLEKNQLLEKTFNSIPQTYQKQRTNKKVDLIL